MYQRMTAIFLVLLLLLSGCSAAPQPEEQAVAEVQPETNPEIQTETVAAAKPEAQPKPELPEALPLISAPDPITFTGRTEEEIFRREIAEKRQKSRELSESIGAEFASYTNDFHVAKNAIFYEGIAKGASAKGFLRRDFGTDNDATVLLEGMDELLGTADHLLFFLIKEEKDYRLAMLDGNNGWARTELGTFNGNSISDYRGFVYGNYAVLFCPSGRLVVELSAQKATYTAEQYLTPVFCREGKNLCYTVYGTDGSLELRRCDLSNGETELLARFSRDHYPRAIEYYNGKIGLLTSCYGEYTGALYSTDPEAKTTKLLQVFEMANGHYSSCGLWEGTAYISYLKNGLSYGFMTVDYLQSKVTMDQDRDVTFVYSNAYGLVYSDEDKQEIRFLNRTEDLNFERPVLCDFGQVFLGPEGLFINGYINVALQDGKWQ